MSGGRLPARSSAVAGHVPGLDHALLTLPAEHRDRCGFELEQPAVAHRQAEPACGERPKHVAVREGERVERLAANPGDDSVDPRGDVSRRLAILRTVTPDRPAGALFVDLWRRPAL